MTENQLFPMSTELFDTSSNSSNPLKYDLYSLGLTTSVGSATTALFATFSNNTSGGIVGSLGTNSLFNSNNNSHNSNNTSGNNSGGSGATSSSNNTSGSNVMLTNAITIPRSNNPNQSHNPYQDEAQHHPTNSPFLSHILQHQNLQQQQQQQQQQHLNTMMSSSSNLQQQQQQQQQQSQNQSGLLSTSLSEYSDYAFDALDASLPSTLLQDVSLSAASHGLNSGPNSSNSLASPFYSPDPSSPLSNNQSSTTSVSNSNGNNSNSLNLNNSSSTDISGVITFQNAHSNNDDSSSLLYDSHNIPNSMWGDINLAITTKHEPFSMDENYIFALDKSDANNTSFVDFEGAIGTLEDIGNLEDLLPSSGSHDDHGHTFHLLSPSTPSPGMGPPMELLQQQQQEQQHIQQFSQLQNLKQQQNSNSPAGGDSNNGGNSNNNSNNGNNNSNNNNNSLHIHQQSSSSPYDIYHSTPNKQQMQQQQHNTNFSPGSLPSPSPLQMNSITPPPPHANRSQYQVKSRNMQELQRKGFSISPDRNNSSSAIFCHSVPGNNGLLMSGHALSPSSGSSGFGSTNGANISTGSSTHAAPVISLNSARKQYHFQAANEGNAISRLSSSAPTHLGPADIWMRREPRQHLLSTSSLAEAESFSSLSTGSVLSPDGHDYSQDDDDDASTDYNSDHYDDLSSENGSDNEDDSSTLHGRSNSISSSSQQLSSSKGKERFFWQYNVQAKGPKGKRLVFQSKLEDPHVLNEVTDPVFSPNCSVRGIKVYKHSGKARKGDGNDLTPNPRKLHNIGKELDRLSRTINDMTPVSELPFNVRPKSRKEKNKLASRACRLKKKAQHEANKIKLYGLEIEHKRLLNAISDIKQNLALKYRKQNVGENLDEVEQQIERIYKHAIGGLAIAGSSTDFVNKVLENVKNGQPSGGLEELRNT